MLDDLIAIEVHQEGNPHKLQFYVDFPSFLGDAIHAFCVEPVHMNRYRFDIECELISQELIRLRHWYYNIDETNS
jgi:hypothetical protein